MESLAKQQSSVNYCLGEDVQLQETRDVDSLIAEQLNITVKLTSYLKNFSVAQAISYLLRSLTENLQLELCPPGLGKRTATSGQTTIPRRRLDPQAKDLPSSNLPAQEPASPIHESHSAQNCQDSLDLHEILGDESKFALLHSRFLDIKKKKPSGYTEDPAEKCYIKLFCLVGGMQDRYMTPQRYNFGSVLDRVKKDIRYQGTKGPDEDRCLAELNKKLSKDFRLNNRLYYCDHYASTPDATLYAGSTLTAVAEFKSTGLNLAEGVAKLKNPGRLQLAVAMKASRCSAGYLVIYSRTDVAVQILAMESADVDAPKFAEREAMFAKYFADLKSTQDPKIFESIDILLKMVVNSS